MLRKHNLQQSNLKGSVKKLLMVLVMLGGVIQMNAQNTSLGITLNLRNVSIQEFMKQIEARTNFTFVYRDILMDTKKDISIQSSNRPLVEVIKTVLDQKGLEAHYNNNTIVLTKKKEVVQSKAKIITGLVIDEKGEPIIGATIMNTLSNEGTITGIDGKFSLPIKSNRIQLKISYIGYENQIIELKDEDFIKVMMFQSIKKLDEVIVVGYGTQRKGNITGAISSIKSAEITATPKSNVTNSLAGRLPGLVSFQSTGQPGYDAASISIRSFGNALVIVDGVESSLGNIDPNEIESISILKDGSASIYGSRAGNGVILVTTKRGNIDKPTITLNATYSGQGVTRMLRPPSSGQYAEMISEAWINAGKPAELAPFSPEVIQKYYDNDDTQYPNTDWYNKLIRDWAPMYQTNLSIRGGSDKIRYYGFLGYMNQETMWKKNGGNFERYNFRSNIDAEVTDNISIELNLSGIQENRLFPLRMQDPNEKGIWQDYWTTYPIYPFNLPDETKLSYADGVGTGGVHITSNMERSGYSQKVSNTFNGSGSILYKSLKIKGLTAKAIFNIGKNYGTSKFFARPYQFYLYDVASGTYIFKGASGEKASLSIYQNQSNTFNTQYSINYDNTLNELNVVKAMLVYETTSYRGDYLSASRKDFLSPEIEQLFGGSTEGMVNDGTAYEMGRKSVVARLAYSFSDKYLLESTMRADASAKFPPAKRWGYFPGLSVGWIMSNEKYLSKIKNIDFIKIRASYGSSGNDGIGNFQYLAGYRIADNYNFGNGEEIGIISTGLANPLLTWEEVKIYNTGIDFSFFNRYLYGEIDAFYRAKHGILSTRINSLPSTFGADLPPENINSLNDRGFEFKLGSAARIRDFSFDINGNISWSRSKWIHFEEPMYADIDQHRLYTRSGKWTDRNVGYVSNGLFTSQEEIDHLGFDQDQKQNKTLRPGDIRYVDVNADGILDWKDQKEIGKGTIPHWMLGFNVNLRFRNIYVTTLFQGAFGYYNNIVLVDDNSVIMPSNIVYDLRWTESKNYSNSLVPRLGGAETNRLFSDYNFKKAGYLRLKDISIGYNILNKYLKDFKIYVAGTNILTVDKLKKYGIDPEAPSGNQQGTWYYPQQRTISFGASMSF